MSQFFSCFESMIDTRVNRRKKYKLIDIIGLVLCGVLAGCESWYEIEEFGKYNIVELKKILSLENGIPSHDTLNRVFSIIDPEVFSQCFTNWVHSIWTIKEGSLLHVDGKRMVNSGEQGKASILHMVSAWCSDLGIALGQVKTEEKSNEITAIPELLKGMYIKKNIVTIDAMGCQKEIALQIAEQGGDYVLAVKDNQSFLLDDLQEAFENSKEIEMAISIGSGHGRVEKRTCKVIKDVDWVCKKAEWKNLKSLILVETERTNKATLKTQKEKRFYISSGNFSAERFNHIIRSHWQVENNLHWCLDVIFNEDQSTKRAGFAAQNFGVVRKMSLNLLSHQKTEKKMSLKLKMKRCSWDFKYILEALNFIYEPEIKL